MEKIHSENLSPIELFKLKCGDLNNVGPDKPVGYLPLETIVDYVGKNINIKEITQYLHNKGLNLIVVKDGGWPGVYGSLYAYDKVALQKILDENKQVLLDANWPATADEFVSNLKIQERVGTPLYKVIAKTFGDKFSKGLKAEE